MKNREVFLLSALSFTTGIILGFLISPVKNGIGNNSGNSVNIHYNGKMLKADESNETQTINE